MKLWSCSTTIVIFQDNILQWGSNDFWGTIVAFDAFPFSIDQNCSWQYFRIFYGIFSSNHGGRGYSWKMIRYRCLLCKAQDPAQTHPLIHSQNHKIAQLFGTQHVQVQQQRLTGGRTGSWPKIAENRIDQA